MSKFKVGDRVKYIDGSGISGEGLKVGEIVTIDENNNSHPFFLREGQDKKSPRDCGFEECFELVSEDSKPQPKFKVGDRVVCMGIDISCEVDRKDYANGIQKSPLVVGEIYEVTNINYADYGSFVDVVGNGVHVSGTYATQFKLINNEPSNSSRNKVSKIMGNIKSFVKNSLLSADEKLLRKYGFKDSCGDYTEDAKDFAIAKLCAEKEADMITVAQGLDAEASKK